MEIDDETRQLLEERRRKFEITQHPLDLWSAYWVYRQADLPLPEWLLAQFDQIFKRLCSATFRYPPDYSQHWAKSVAAVFGFRTSADGGPANPFESARRLSERFDIAVRVRVLVDGDGHNETDAYYLVREQYADFWRRDVSEVFVRRAWKQFKDVARMHDLDGQRYSIQVEAQQIEEERARARSLSETPEVSDT